MDGVSFLTVYLVLLCAIPSYLIIPALGSVGRLSVLWGLAGLIWWAFAQLAKPTRMRFVSPIGVALRVFVGMVALSYGLAHLRGLPEGLATTADSSLLRVLSWAGVALVALEIRNRERLIVMLSRIAWAGALMSALGLLQFVTRQSLVTSFSLPGFAVVPFFESVGIRSEFVRAAGTASHPLEYGTLLCVSLPLAIAVGVTDTRRAEYLRWLPASLITLAALLSVSRSTMACVLVGVILLAPGIPARLRTRGAVLGGFLIITITFLIPGMLGTIRGMFMAMGNDASTLSRTDSVPAALQIAERNLWFGRGFGTFLPNELVLDNQMLLLLIECGLLGLGTFLGLVLTCLISGWRVAVRAHDATDRLLATALAASVAAGSTTLLLFDGLSFPIAAGILFLVCGVTGAAANLLRSDPGTS